MQFKRLVHCSLWGLALSDTRLHGGSVRRLVVGIPAREDQHYSLRHDRQGEWRLLRIGFVECRSVSRNPKITGTEIDQRVRRLGYEQKQKKASCHGSRSRGGRKAVRAPQDRGFMARGIFRVDSRRPAGFGVGQFLGRPAGPCHSSRGAWQHHVAAEQVTGDRTNGGRNPCVCGQQGR